MLLLVVMVALSSVVDLSLLKIIELRVALKEVVLIFQKVALRFIDWFVKKPPFSRGD